MEYAMQNDHVFLRPIPYGSLIAVYGTGEMSRILLEHLRIHRPDVRVTLFIDSFSSGIKGSIKQITPSEINLHRESFELIIVASCFHGEIRETLYSLGEDKFFVFDSDRIIDPTPQYCVFQANFISTSQAHVRKHWRSLRIGADDEAYYKTLIEKVLPYTMVSYHGLIALCELVEHCETNGIPGAFVETGCCRGGASALMAMMNLRHGRSPRAMHLFDSFEGLPEPVSGKDDIEQLKHLFQVEDLACDGNLTATGFISSQGPEPARQAMLRVAGYDPGFVHIHRGWFQDTVPATKEAIGPIALLRLDGDFYDSTSVPLEHLHDQVVPGGIVYIDDWCINGCRSACEDFLGKRGLRPLIHRVDDCGRYWVKE